MSVSRGIYDNNLLILDRALSSSGDEVSSK
jgi:hypothetical protein